MSVGRGLILDANILIRAVFRTKVRDILERFANEANFFSPEACFEEARRYIPALCKKRGLDASLALSVLRHVGKLVLPVSHSLYADREADARGRIENRDPDDWPVVAVALMFDFPVWTEDKDFFGAGVATWTSSTVEVYLRSKR